MKLGEVQEGGRDPRNLYPWIFESFKMGGVNPSPIASRTRTKIYIKLAEVPGFARGIPRTIKYKCAIIAHQKCQFRPFL